MVQPFIVQPQCIVCSIEIKNVFSHNKAAYLISKLKEKLSPHATGVIPVKSEMYVQH